MSAEDNPAEDVQPTKEEWDSYQSGGPAFPTPTPFASEGISARDYFACAALQGMLSADGNDPRWTGRDTTELYQRGGGKWLDPCGIARQAYEIADAMIRERQKGMK